MNPPNNKLMGVADLKKNVFNPIGEGVYAHRVKAEKRQDISPGRIPGFQGSDKTVR